MARLNIVRKMDVLFFVNRQKVWELLLMKVSIEQPVLSPNTSLAIARQLVGRMTSPSQALSRADRVAVVEQALNQMEPLDREVIALRHFEELTNGEVAEVLGISVQTASKRYVRAIKRMKDIVSAIPGFDPL